MRTGHVIHPTFGSARAFKCDPGTRRIGAFPKFRRIILPILLFVCGIANPAARADLIYTINAYPDVTSPYTVSGTITTNGATGTSLPGSDIIAWDITISQASSTIVEITPTNSVE